MFRFLRIVALGCCVAASVPPAQAFSLLGTAEPYTSTAALGHEGSPNFGQLPAFANWVKNLDDEYRWNTEVLYYTFDSEFLSYFGSNGIVAVERAIAMYNALTNVSSYSSNLTEFPLEAKRENYTASALGLLDVTSYTFETLLKQLGLADPDYFTWTLLNRALPPGAQCPAYAYNVVQRNFDPVTLSPTPYVNGNLLTYRIVDLCPTPDEADAVEVLVDPLASLSTAVASSGALLGDYWTGLTRDDIGGLRYMLRTNNVNWETTPANAVIFATNPTPVLLFTSNLQVFATQSVTNSAAEMEALYPGLIITATSNYFVNVVETNLLAYFTNSPYAPAGSPPVLVLATNFTTNIATRFVHSFGNLVTNEFYPFCLQSLLVTNIAPSPLSPPGSGISVTNVTVETVVDTNCVSGSFYLLPTNICAFDIISTQLTQVVLTTNLLTNTFVTNLVTFTNATGSNQFDYYEFSISELIFFTNRTFVARPVACPDQITSLFQGIDRMRFVRRDFDSLLGQFFQPVTNAFSMVEITNNTRVIRSGQRSVIQPDITFSAAVLAPPPTAWPLGLFVGAVSEPNHVTATNANPLGPGVIQTTISITLNKVGNVLFNQGPAFITEADAFSYFRWGSFDGTTNAPIVYPVGSDLLSLENMAVLQILQPSVVVDGALELPDGNLGAVYSGAGFQLVAAGGTPPYTWTVEPGSNPLPPGLTVSASGLISGTPAVAGVFDFSLRLTEAASRNVVYPFTLTVLP